MRLRRSPTPAPRPPGHPHPHTTPDLGHLPPNGYLYLQYNTPCETAPQPRLRANTHAPPSTVDGMVEDRELASIAKKTTHSQEHAKTRAGFSKAQEVSRGWQPLGQPPYTQRHYLPAGATGGSQSACC